MSINGYGGVGGRSARSLTQRSQMMQQAEEVIQNQDVAAITQIQQSLQQAVLDPTLTSVDPFSEMIHRTWPNPEIIKCDIKAPFRTIVNGQKVDQFDLDINLKVNVSGNFLNDEWFWKDYLKYFKLTIFLLNEVSDSGKNSDIFTKSLFNEESGRRFRRDNIYYPRSYILGKADVPITELQNKRNKLSNSYVFEGNFTLFDVTNPSGGLLESLIVARTFFDINSFADDFLGGLKSENFSSLTPENNGRWDVLQFEMEIPNVSVGGPNIRQRQSYPRSMQKIQASFVDNPSVKWNGAFISDADNFKFYAPPPSSFVAPDPKSLAEIRFTNQAFNKTDNQISQANSAMRNFLDKQKEIVLKNVNVNKLPKFEKQPNLNSVFSDLYIGTDLNGFANLHFSFDCFDLFKQISNVPDAIFDNIERSIGSNIIRNIKIIDQGVKDFNKGNYQYYLSVSVVDKIEKFVLNNVEKLKGAISELDKFNLQAANSDSVNTQTQEFSQQFINSQANGTLKNLNKAVDIFYDIIESNLLDNFMINSFKLYRKHIKNDFNNIELNNKEADVIILDTEETGPMSFQEIEGVFSEFDKPVISFQGNLEVSRQELKETFKIENMNLEKSLEFARILEMFQKQMLSLIREGNTPSALNDKSTGRKSSRKNLLNENFIKFGNIYDAEKAKTGYYASDLQNIDIFSPRGIILDKIKYPYQDRIKQPDIDNYLLSNVEDLNKIQKVAPIFPDITMSQVYLNDFALNHGISFKFAQKVEKDEKINTKSKEIEVLDIGDKKYLTTCSEDNVSQMIEKSSVRNLFASLSNTDSDFPTVSLEYLSGYVENDEEENVMKKPFFSPVSNLSTGDRGKHLLFRIRVTEEKGKKLPIYNEYFLKKV